ncbi:glycosyl hydrolase family 8 [Jannaschia formosa]|uniref:glycosyl hydrolase family 8 n=1 Tax=Jannaschia formosa TaxID=2259592 RepID=UPI000E1BF705|nr:glycosyl hydrolase family 8 [Jannaschia formosa]TFL17190.1 glycosyl hydrolase family 5 [Jannaschia formosa]
MRRRDLLSSALAAGALGTGSARALTGRGGWPEAWECWKAAFLDPEGRVVDALQGEASHSEGQGWAMLLAVAFDDRDAFDRLRAWTETHLAVRQDPLLAWRWRPGEGVADYNNATDGDLFFAWAHLRAARRFGDPALARRARAVAEAIDRILVVAAPGGDTLLLRPAAERFAAPGAETINPSYLMPLALHDLAASFGLPRLARAAADGEAGLAELAAPGLVPDWATRDDAGWSRPAGLSGAYGYDALRVPLYLIWSGRFAHPAVARVRALLAATPEATPVRAEAGTGRVIETSDAPGYAAVAALVTCSGAAVPAATIPGWTASQAYYPATLHLLAALAASEAAPHCLGDGAGP